MFLRFIILCFAIILPVAATAAPKLKPPKLLSIQKPAYPVEQLNPWRKYKVVVSFTVNVAGLPENLVVSQSSGIPLLDQAVLDILQKATFSPALDENDQPVVFAVKQPYLLENPKSQLEQSCESLNTEIASRAEQSANSTAMDIDFVASIQGLAAVLQLMQKEAMTAETLKKATKVREQFLAECKANAGQPVETALKTAFQKYKLPFK